MIERNEEISIRKQAELLGIARSSLYYKQVICEESELINEIREIYLSSECRYGYRKIKEALEKKGVVVNSKKMLKIMKELKIKGIEPRKKEKYGKSQGHKIYPYLLEGLEIKRVNQVWASDITYIKIKERYMYLTAIIDIYSRYVISYDVHHNMEAENCVTVLEEALNKARPEIFNTDQGSQFTSEEFTKRLVNAQVQISMDHKGRCFDNIYIERFWRTLKQESIYYYRPETITELEKCIKDFVLWYNNHRLHQSLDYKTPASIYCC